MMKSIGYYLIFGILLTKIAAGQGITWEKMLGSCTYGVEVVGIHAIKSAPDGTFIALGSTDTSAGTVPIAVTIKLDAYGNVMWRKSTYGDFYFATGQALEITGTEGECVIAGHANTTPGDGFFLRKYNADGQTLWTKTYSPLNNNVDWGYYLSMAATVDSGYILTGSVMTSYPNYSNELFLMKCNNEGDSLWMKVFPAGFLDDYYAKLTVIQSSDTGYMVCGTGSPGLNIKVVKFDSYGTLKWEREYDTFSESSGMDIIQTSDGNYLIAGNVIFPGNYNPDAFLMKIDPIGDTLWCKSLCQNGFGDTYYAVTEDPAMGYVAAGQFRSGNFTVPYASVTAFDFYGDTLWTQIRYQASGTQSRLYDINLAEDGYITGGNSYNNMMAVRLDGGGNGFVAIPDQDQTGRNNADIRVVGKNLVIENVQNAKEAVIYIYDKLGRTVKTNKAGSVTGMIIQDISDLAPGQYVVKVIAGLDIVSAIIMVS